MSGDNHQLQGRLLGHRYRSQRRHLHVYRTRQPPPITSQGVLGAPDANGVRTGVMTNNVTLPAAITSAAGR